MKAFAVVLIAGALPVATLNAQGAGATESTESCFLTPAEVEAVSGEKVKGRPRGQLRDLMGLKAYRCTYRGDDFTAVSSLEVGRSREDLQLFLKMLGAVAKGNTTTNSLQPVQGLGDQAWWGQINPTNGNLHIIRGTDVLTIQTYGKAGGGNLEKTRKLAEKAYAAYLKTRK
jgi:hypothetical protein